MWSKDDSSNLGLLFTYFLKRAWKNVRVNSEIFKNLLWNSLSASIARLKFKDVLLKISLLIKFLFKNKPYLITISFGVSANAIIQCQI